MIEKAGTIIWRHSQTSNQKEEILLVHRQRYDDWSLPKGHLEEGETPLQAALRETKEETGFDCKFLTPLPDFVYTMSSGEHARVFMFFGVLKDSSQNFDPQDTEVDEIKWVTLAQALTIVSYPSLREYLTKNFLSSLL